MAGPEVASQGQERIDLNELKETKNSLGELKRQVEAKTDASITMSKLVDTALRELERELGEANIATAEKQSYLEEYRVKADQEIAKIKADNIIESPEAIALEAFMTNINNFPKLKAINDVLGKSDLENKYGKMIATVDDLLTTAASILGWNIGEPHLRAKIYEGIGWLAKKVGINLGDELNKKYPEANPENFDNKDVFELLRLSSKTASEGESVRNFLSAKFPKEQFGELKSTTETTLVFRMNDKEIMYEIGRNAMGNPIVVLAGEEQIYDGKLESLIGAINKLNPIDNRNS